MKSLVILVSLFLYQTTLFAETTIGNGMGASEANIMYAYKNLNTELKEFLFSYSDTLTRNEVSTLRKWIQKANIEKETKLIFVNKEEFPGQDKKYYTKELVKSDVYFNLNSLFKYDLNEEMIPLSIGDGVLLSIEINERTFDAQNQEKVLKGKILNSYASSTEQINLHSREELRLILRGSRDMRFTSKVFLTDFDGIFDITNELKDSLYCPDQYSVDKLKVSNLYVFTSDFPNQSIQNAKFNGALKYNCVFNNQSIEFFGDIIIFAQYHFKLKSSEVSLFKNWNDKSYSVFLNRKNITVTTGNLHR